MISEVQRSKRFNQYCRHAYTYFVCKNTTWLTFIVIMGCFNKSFLRQTNIFGDVFIYSSQRCVHCKLHDHIYVHTYVYIHKFCFLIKIICIKPQPNRVIVRCWLVCVNGIYYLLHAFFFFNENILLKTCVFQIDYRVKIPNKRFLQLLNWRFL